MSLSGEINGFPEKINSIDMLTKNHGDVCSVVWQ
jgi:hypothetical protein